MIVGYLNAYVKVVGKGTIYVGRDPRPHGEMVEHIVCGALLSLGCSVVRLGIVPTPTVEIMVANNTAAGGIIITASHNPPQWNALKFNGKGMFLEKDVVNQVIGRFNESWKEPLAQWDEVALPQSNARPRPSISKKYSPRPLLWFVGSSSKRISGSRSNNLHKATLLLSPPDRIFTGMSPSGQRKASMALSSLLSNSQAL